MRELMATKALPGLCVAERACVWCGRNASMSSRKVRAGRPEVQVLAGAGSLSGSNWMRRQSRLAASLTPISFFTRVDAHHPYHTLLHLRILCSCFIMSAQQCLRRLPASMRAVPALRAGARSVNRGSAARSYSAIARATSSGLLSQAARCVIVSSCQKTRP
jgi:hypothetical protein